MNYGYPGAQGQQGYPGAQGYPGQPPVVVPQQQQQSQEWMWFSVVDADRSGRLSVHEVQTALQSAEWPQLQYDSARMILNIFDVQKVGTIDFQQFQAMVKYIRQWFECFKRFDQDRSGMIDRNELKNALKTFGYNINDVVVNAMLRKYDKLGRGSITFDDFIKCCVSVKSLTEGFQKYDTQRNGWATVNYDNFMELAFNSY